MNALNKVLCDPTLQIGLRALAPTNPALWSVVYLVAATFSSEDKIVAVIDEQAAGHVKSLASGTLSNFERQETEIRLHELLTILNRLGQL